MYRITNININIKMYYNTSSKKVQWHFWKKLNKKVKVQKKFKN